MTQMTWAEVTQVYGAEVSKTAWLAGVDLKVDPTVEVEGSDATIFALTDDQKMVSAHIPPNMGDVSWVRVP